MVCDHAAAATDERELLRGECHTFEVADTELRVAPLHPSPQVRLDGARGANRGAEAVWIELRQLPVTSMTPSRRPSSGSRTGAAEHAARCTG
jgi:hypothetical protein